jgi:zinc transport system ATP-binding protein
MSLIQIRNLDVRLGGNTVLRDVSMRVEKGEIITIVGPNGSGKTTLLRAIIGAVGSSTGQVEKRAELRIGYVPQRLQIDVTLPMTVRRFLSLPRPVSDTSAEEVLTDAGVGQMVRLSGGQFQRVLLARALLGRPELLLLDEPTQGLDQPGSAAFYRQIETVRQNRGCAVLMVSHELHVVMAASDRVICLNGHVCCHGAPGQVAKAPEYRALFGTGTQGALALYQHEHTHSHHHESDG